MRRTFVLLSMVLFAATASAQVTPAAGFVPPDDTQALRVGMTMFLDNTYMLGPKGTTADCAATPGCSQDFTPSAFNVGRTYLNVTGTISHIVSYRISPDLTGLVAGTSYPLRIKYAYAQFSLDDWIKNSRTNWVRFGQQQTPWIDFEEGIYRYRFQGTVFGERSGGYLSSSDRGASFHYTFPANWGDVHTGIYNGENYQAAETNQQKAWRTRVTVRPFARMAPLYRGLRASVFYDKDSYQTDAERKRVIGAVTFEHQYVNAAFQYMVANDQGTALGTPFNREGKGYSIWAVPKQGAGNLGWEGLIRYDHLVPDTRSTAIPVSVGTNAVTFEQQERNRVVVGIAYWFPHPAGGATTAIMFDFDGLTTGPGVPNATGGIVGVSGIGTAAPSQTNPGLTASGPFLPTPTFKTFTIRALLNF